MNQILRGLQNQSYSYTNTLDERLKSDGLNCQKVRLIFGKVFIPPGDSLIPIQGNLFKMEGRNLIIFSFSSFKPFVIITD